MIGDIKTANYLREVELHKAARRRRDESEAAERANQREYAIDPESQAALDRGDLQREGVDGARKQATVNVADIVRFENEEMDWDETVRFFQALVDTGLAWQLQGSYGRHARWLIDTGVIVQPRNG